MGVPQLSDDEFIEQIRDRYVNRRKYMLLAAVCFFAAIGLSLFSAFLMYQEWIAISRSVNPTTEPFWIGVGLGCLLGVKVGVLLVVSIHTAVSFVTAARGGERTQRLLLQRHDLLCEALGQSPNQPLRLTGDARG